MTDLAPLFREAAYCFEVEPGADAAAADLHRGRRAASRLRTRRLLIRGAGIAAVAAIALTVGLQHGPDGRHPARLVAYEGSQAPGFTVDQVPAGWTVQGSTGVGTDDASVTIAPDGDSDTDPSHLDGKLVVRDGVTADDPGAVHVGDVVGSLGNDDGSQSAVLYVVRVDPDGALLTLQVPTILDWTQNQAAAFTEGVHVTG